MAVYLGDYGFGYVEFLFLYDLYFMFMRLSGILGFSVRSVKEMFWDDG